MVSKTKINRRKFLEVSTVLAGTGLLSRSKLHSINMRNDYQNGGSSNTTDLPVSLTSKKFYTKCSRHRRECYNTVMDSKPGSRAIAYLRVHGKRESLVYGYLMGQDVKCTNAEINLKIDAAEKIHEIQIVRNGDDVNKKAVGNLQTEYQWQAQRITESDFWYCRIIFENGEMAWTSPIRLVG